LLTLVEVMIADDSSDRCGSVFERIDSEL